jgi:hypothetical protein
MQAWMAILFCCLLCGCTISRKGTVHHIIVGFGIISVSQTNRIEITKSQALGLAIYVKEGFRFNAGYSSSVVASIPDSTTNTIIEISQRPFSPLMIKAP